MIQMSRQNDKCLNQGKGQNTDHRLGHDGNKFTHDTGDMHQWCKGYDGCCYRHHHGPPDLGHPVDHGLPGGFTHPEMGIDIFSHNNGIINQDAQCHDKAEHGEHIQGCTKIVQD